MTKKRFTFISKALSKDTFAVVSFKGVEGISRPYEFDITLASEDPDIDLKDVLRNPATITIIHDEQDFPIHGLLAQFEQLYEVKQHVFYRAVLVPRLWQASLYQGNQLFLDKSVPDIIEEVLKQAGLTTKDYDLKLTNKYPKWEYICQYQETHLNFISRWMEHEGIYYFFEQTEQGEKLIITDSSTAHQDIKGEKKVDYSPPSAMVPEEEEVVSAFLCRQRMLPKKVILKDYNYRKPSLEIKAEASVDSNGRGDVYLYGEHFKDPGQGAELAKIRAEELLCREKVFCGEATVPTLSPGFIFELASHFRDSYNQKYLITEVEHKGERAGVFLSTLEENPTEEEKKLTYASRFTCIPATVQFRPERKTARPRFYGTMNAVVDAAGDGKYAELDDQGRYKVILPFDLSGNSGGKASRWIRMAQPYSGFTATDGLQEPSGMHFPLHKGAEVLLTFVDGDPDRPIISSAIPNPETVSPVTSANQTKSIIRDNYGNEIIFDSTPGDEHLRLYSPHHKSGIELGRSANVWTDSDDNSLKIGNQATLAVGMKTEATIGAVTEFKAGLITEGLLGTKLEFSYGGSHKFEYMYDRTYADGPIIHSSNMDILSLTKKDQVLGAGDGVGIVGGAGPDGKSRSIINLKPEYLTLSVGPKEVRTIARPNEQEEYSGQIFEEYLPSTHLRWKTAGGLITALVPTIVGAVFGFVAGMSRLAGERKESLKLPANIASLAVGSFFGVLALLYGIGFHIKEKKEEREKRIEPVEHVDPAAMIKMNENGEININSKDNKVVLGVGEPWDEDIQVEISKDNINIITGRKQKEKSSVEIGKKGIKIRSDKKVDIISKDEINLSSYKQVKIGRYFVDYKGDVNFHNLKIFK